MTKAGLGASDGDWATSGILPYLKQLRSLTRSVLITEVQGSLKEIIKS